MDFPVINAIDISRWIEEGREIGATYFVLETDKNELYPVFLFKGEKKKKEKTGAIVPADVIFEIK